MCYTTALSLQRFQLPLQNAKLLPPTLAKIQAAPIRKAGFTFTSVKSAKSNNLRRECNGMDYSAGNETRPEVEEPQGEDPYQVRWDNGDEDPMSLRSMTLLRK
jgi:hypothetical protein